MGSEMCIRDRYMVIGVIIAYFFTQFKVSHRTRPRDFFRARYDGNSRASKEARLFFPVSLFIFLLPGHFRKAEKHKTKSVPGRSFYQ